MSRDIQVFLASLNDLFWTSSIYCCTLIIKFRNKHWLNIEFRNKEFLTTILFPKQDYYFKCLIIEISIKTFYLFDENLFKLQRQFSNIREHLEMKKMENTSHNSSTSKILLFILVYGFSFSSIFKIFYCCHCNTHSFESYLFHLTLYNITNIFQVVIFIIIIVFNWLHYILLNSLVVKKTDCGARLPGFVSQLSHLLALWSWASFLTSLCLSFSIL